LWDLSDKIRDSLQSLGIVVEDKKHGSSWKRVSDQTGDKTDR
jgi:cysteinyl-tRNA synthetase